MQADERAVPMMIPGPLSRRNQDVGPGKPPSCQTGGWKIRGWAVWGAGPYRRRQLFSRALKEMGLSLDQYEDWLPWMCCWAVRQGRAYFVACAGRGAVVVVVVVVKDGAQRVSKIRGGRGGLDGRDLGWWWDDGQGCCHAASLGSEMFPTPGELVLFNKRSSGLKG